MMKIFGILGAIGTGTLLLILVGYYYSLMPFTEDFATKFTEFIVIVVIILLLIAIGSALSGGRSEI